jgi:hypothetical protein
MNKKYIGMVEMMKIHKGQLDWSKENIGVGIVR